MNSDAFKEKWKSIITHGWKDDVDYSVRMVTWREFREDLDALLMKEGNLDELRLRLADGKYTKQYADLTLDQLHGLFWLLGEWSVRARSEVPVQKGLGGESRMGFARNALVRFDRQPMGIDEVKALMRAAVGPPDGLPAKVGDVFRFEYEYGGGLNFFERAVSRIDGSGPDDQVHFSDGSFTSQKNLVGVKKIKEGT